MMTRLYPTNSEDHNVYRFINGLSQAMQDELYPFRVSTMHDAIDGAKKVKLKLRMSPLLLELNLLLLSPLTLLLHHL